MRVANPRIHLTLFTLLLTPALSLGAEMACEVALDTNLTSAGVSLTDFTLLEAYVEKRGFGDPFFQPGGARVLPNGRFFILAQHIERPTQFVPISTKIQSGKVFVTPGPVIALDHEYDDEFLTLSPNLRFIGFNDREDNLIVFDCDTRQSHNLGSVGRLVALTNEGASLIYDSRNKRFLLQGLESEATAILEGVGGFGHRENWVFREAGGKGTLYYTDGSALRRRLYTEESVPHVLIENDVEGTTLGGLAIAPSFGVVSRHKPGEGQDSIPLEVIKFDPNDGSILSSFEIEVPGLITRLNRSVLSPNGRFYVLDSGDYLLVVDLQTQRVILTVELRDGMLAFPTGFDPESTRFHLIWRDTNAETRLISIELPDPERAAD